MLQQDSPSDYVIGTGKEYSVEQFAEQAFNHAGLNYKDHIIIDNQLKRPAEVDSLLADFSRARKLLKWEPKVSFDNLIKDMVDSDVKSITDKGY
jgi:GDPmannose 4,6-dehydratase